MFLIHTHLLQHGSPEVDHMSISINNECVSHVNNFLLSHVKSIFFLLGKLTVKINFVVICLFFRGIITMSRIFWSTSLEKMGVVCGGD